MFGNNNLIFIPHPDDEVIGATAAILHARARGKKVFGFYLTTGIYPNAKRYNGKVFRRQEEARTAADWLGIEILSFETISSRKLKENFSIVRTKINQILKEKNIDSIWTPAYEGGHQDHDVANFLASTLQSRANIFEFSEYHFFKNKSRSNTFFNPNGTEEIFTLTPEEKRIKKKALSLYSSEWFNLKVVRPSLEQEMFRPLANYDYTTPPYEGKMFYQRFQRFSFHPKVDKITPQELSRFFRGRSP